MRSIVIATAVVAFVTGCSTNDSSPSANVTTTNATNAGKSTTTPDPCQLVTKDEAAQVLGAQPEDGKTVGGGLPGQRDCGYAIAGSVKLVTVTVFPGDAALFEQHRAEIKKPDPKFEDITGIGDGAFRSVGYMYVRKGQFIVTLFVSGFGSEGEVRAKLLELAPKAVARL